MCPALVRHLMFRCEDSQNESYNLRLCSIQLCDQIPLFIHYMFGSWNGINIQLL